MGVNVEYIASGEVAMDCINTIPKDFLYIVPKFDGNERLLNLFIKKCEYLIKSFGGNQVQDQYVFHVITSRLTGRAAGIVSDRQDIETWPELKEVLTQHFGDSRSEECLAIELENLKIKSGETYPDFCNRLQFLKSTLLSKVNKVGDPCLRASKIVIYNNMAMKVFLYNLPEDLMRVVRLKGCETLDQALTVVLDEINFQHQYNSRFKAKSTSVANSQNSHLQYSDSYIQKFNGLDDGSMKNINVRPITTNISQESVDYCVPNVSNHGFRSEIESKRRLKSPSECYKKPPSLLGKKKT